MSTQRQWRWNRIRQWHVLAAILIVLLLGFGLWLLPRRTREVVLVDGAHRWNERTAPPQRKVVWRPAEPIAATPARRTSSDSLVRPQLAEGGIALYYTLQHPGGEADIYRSQFDGRRWLPGEPVTALNSPASDFGPVISADGKTLFLYSDRPGGYGGFDLYCSRLTSAGWSRPENLGPRLNTPAHEYDPATSPKGDRLYFASNRTRQMEELIADNLSDPNQHSPWKATLRAEPGRQHFDIYVAEIDANVRGWKAATKLAGVNTSSANEGEPYVSPDGAFLYFASDRPNTRSDGENYDLYRARLVKGGVSGVENLGAGVNSAANEHDPSLSPEGFRLLFSSDRKHQTNDDRYALYSSQAMETYDDASWNTSHIATLANLWWWIVLALLLICLIAAIVWYLREVSLRRAPVPVFFLVALFLHLIALTGAFFIPIEGVTLAERISKEFHRIVATNVQLESTHQSHTPGEKSYEKVADLQSIEMTQITSTPRRVLENPNMPFPTQRPAPSIPQRLNREHLTERVASRGPAVMNDLQDPQMARRQKIVEEMLADSAVKIEDAQATKDPRADESMSSEEVTANRTSPAQRIEFAAGMPRRTIDPKSQLEREHVDIPQKNEATNRPLSKTELQVIQRLARNEIAPLESPKIEAEAMTQPNPNAAEPPSPMNLELTVERHEDSTPLASLTKATSQSRAAVTAPTIVEAEIGTARPDSVQPNSAAMLPLRSSLTRQDRVAKLDVAAESITTDAPQENSTVARGYAASVPPVPVELSRQVREAIAELGAPALSPQIRAQRASTLKLDFAADDVPASNPLEAKIEAVATLSRRSARSTLEVTERPTVTSDDLPAAVTGSDVANATSSFEGEPLTIDRREIAAVISSGEIPTPKSPLRNNPARLGAIDPAGIEISDVRGPAQSTLEVSPTLLARSNARRDLANLAEVNDINAESMLAGETASASPPAIDDIEVQLARSIAGEMLSVEVQSPDALGGRFDSQRRNELVVGELAKAEVDTDISFSPIGSRIERQRARASFLLYAQDRIGLQAMLRLRVGDDRQKQDLIDAFGGRKDTLEAIQRGLHWLAQVQHDDGHWDLKNFPKGPNGESYSGHGSERSDTAATALALLPFLGDGHTHEAGKYQAVVAKGVGWLTQHQKDDGDLFTGGEGNAQLYSHGIATIALCELFGMTKDQELLGPAQKAVEFIVKSQHEEGGWRYRPRERGDTSVVGWQIMALKSAQMAGINVPQATLDKARDWLNKSRRGQDGREFAYQPGGSGTPAMTAEGLLCMEYLGSKRGEPQLMRTVDYLTERVPQQNQDTSYYWYYGTQAIFHIQGEPWKKWNEAMSDTVITSQVVDGPHRGTWDPRDEWERRGGRIYATSLRLLMLEVYFRHLPLYQALE